VTTARGASVSTVIITRLMGHLTPDLIQFVARWLPARPARVLECR
jgi:hypothetical protein